MGVRGLRSGLQGAKETLRKVKEAAKGVAAGLGAEDVVEATVLEDGGTEVRRQGTVRQDMGLYVVSWCGYRSSVGWWGWERTRAPLAVQGIALADVPHLYDELNHRMLTGSSHCMLTIVALTCTGRLHLSGCRIKKA